MTRYYLVALLAVVMTTASQILLKVATRRAGHEAWRLYLNPYTLMAYLSLALVTLLNLYAFRHIPIKAVIIFLPLTLLLVVSFSVLLLNEKLSQQQIAGSIVILIGLLVFNC